MTKGTKPSISTVHFSALEGNWRLDAEYYQPHYLRYQALFTEHSRLETFSSVILHPVEVKRDYVDSGIQILLAQNIRQNYLDFSLSVYMPEDLEEVLTKNLLQPGDVVITRSGVNYGDSATYLGEPAPLYASADCLVIRPWGIDGAYLSTFLNTRYGRELLKRGGYGAAQPHIAPTYVGELRVPREDTVEREVVELVNQAYQSQRKSKRLYRQAEQRLLDELGLSELGRPEDSFGEADLTDTFQADRIDSDYFEPRYDILLEHLESRGAQPIASIACLRQEGFSPQRGVSFNYIEISNVDLNIGLCQASRVLGEEAPDRAQQVVRASDVIVSTVRPLRGGTALIREDQDGFVCSSGFAALNPLNITPEYLLVYLRLEPIRELLNRYNRASMYPAITAFDILSLPIVVLSSFEESMRSLVQQSYRAYFQSFELLEEARRRVETLIESEAAHG